MSIKALIEIVETHWSGWVPGGYSESKSAKVWAEEKTVMSPETFGYKKADHPDSASLFYEIVVDRIVQDVVVLDLVPAQFFVPAHNPPLDAHFAAYRPSKRA